MSFSNVDSRTRTYLLDEFQRDVNAGHLHVPGELTEQGVFDWPVLLQLTLMESGCAALAQHLGQRGRVRHPEQAAAVAERSFGRLLARAIRRLAIDDDLSISGEIDAVGVSATEAPGAAHYDPRAVLEALRSGADVVETLEQLGRGAAVLAA